MTDRRSDPDAPTAELPPLPPTPPAPRRARVRAPGPFAVIAGSLGLFFAITALLAAQMRRGADPALGAPATLAAAPPAAPVIVRRRVIITRIVEYRPRPSATAPSGPAPSAARPGPRDPTPAQPAPARRAAPAPLTTRSS